MSHPSDALRKRRTSRPLRTAVLALMLAALACRAPTATPTPTPSPTHTPAPIPTWPPTPEPVDTGWRTAEPGLEIRRVPVATGDVIEYPLLIRLAPSQFQFRVLYTPGTARRVSDWAESVVPSTLLVVNAGYFTAEHEATGLLVSDGEAYGVPYGDFAGMFAVLPGGRVEVRWLGTQPYDPHEMVLQGVQSFPMLVRPGGTLGFPADADDGRPARRTVVAQDREGNILFIVAPRGYLTLHELARWLTESDLALDVALNLDGGTSTGLYILTEESPPEMDAQIDSLVPIPSVIVVERRG